MFFLATFPERLDRVGRFDVLSQEDGLHCWRNAPRRLAQALYGAGSAWNLDPSVGKERAD